jgi:hypothetical protein
MRGLRRQSRGSASDWCQRKSASCRRLLPDVLHLGRRADQLVGEPDQARSQLERVLRQLTGEAPRMAGSAEGPGQGTMPPS